MQFIDDDKLVLINQFQSIRKYTCQIKAVAQKHNHSLLMQIYNDLLMTFNIKRFSELLSDAVTWKQAKIEALMASFTLKETIALFSKSKQSRNNCHNISIILGVTLELFVSNI